MSRHPWVDARGRSEMIGRLAGVVLDCPDPHALAAFYSELLGLPITFRVYADPAGHPFCLCTE
jgi:hypothetical protein